jgi:hypothetical protein
MYGILKPYDWRKKWETETGKNFFDTFEEFMNDNAFNDEIKEKEGIFCLSDGRDGRFIIIGKVLEKSSDGEYLGSSAPIKVPDLNIIEKMKIVNNVNKYFGLFGEFNFYFVTNYR